MIHDCGLNTLLLHRNCVSAYTSKTHIKRFLSRRNRKTGEAVVKRTCRSDISPFNFEEHCLICGEKCCPKPDPKHPNRWRRVIQCRTADRWPNQNTFKDVIIDACDLRNDDWGSKFACELKVKLVTYKLLIPSTTKTECRHFDVLVTSSHLQHRNMKCLRMKSLHVCGG